MHIDRSNKKSFNFVYPLSGEIPPSLEDPRWNDISSVPRDELVWIKAPDRGAHGFVLQPAMFCVEGWFGPGNVLLPAHNRPTHWATIGGPRPIQDNPRLDAHAKIVREAFDRLSAQAKEQHAKEDDAWIPLHKALEDALDRVVNPWAVAGKQAADRLDRGDRSLVVDPIEQVVGSSRPMSRKDAMDKSVNDFKNSRMIYVHKDDWALLLAKLEIVKDTTHSQTELDEVSALIARLMKK